MSSSDGVEPFRENGVTASAPAESLDCLELIFGTIANVSLEQLTFAASTRFHAATEGHSRCYAPEMILTRHPLKFGAVAFTFVNAALTLLTRASGVT